MANGLGAPAAGIVQPRVSELVGMPVVEPRSTAALADAFHQGFVTADDIINRIDKRAQLKRKAEEQLYQESLSPQAQEARAAIQQAQKLEAESRAQKAEMDLEDKPFVKRIRRLETARKIAESESFGSIEGIANVLTLAGEDMPVKRDAETGLIVPDVERARVAAQEAKQYLNFTHQLVERRNQIKIGELKSGKTVIKNWVDEGGLTPPGEPALALKKRLGSLTGLTMEQWRALGSPATPQDLGVFSGTAPGRVTPPAGSVAPVAQPAAQPAAQPSGQASNEGLQLGGYGPGGGVVVATGGEGGEPGTEVQVRAKGALARFNQSYDMIESLEDEGFDPTSVWTWANAMMPEILKSGDLKAWESAREAWAQGVLRYESGAAITPHEQKWYTEAFFPKVRDPKWVVDAKAKLRSDMERVISEVANAGGAATPATREFAKKVYDRAAFISGWTGEKGSRDPAKAGYLKRYSTDGKVYWLDPDTLQPFEAGVPSASAPPSLPVKTTTPERPLASPVSSLPSDRPSDLVIPRQPGASTFLSRPNFTGGIRG